jgi:hypothetical protein
MPDPQSQAATQLRNIESSTGVTLAEFTAAVRRAGLERHGQIMDFLQTRYGLSHGNANLVALLVRDELAGGPAAPDDLLAAQYAGARAALRPIYDALEQAAEALGDDVQKVIQKSGVSFRRRKQFALVQAPSAKRVQLGLNLDATPDDPRVVPMLGMCTHRVELTEPSAVDGDVARWIRSAYDRAG